MVPATLLAAAAGVTGLYVSHYAGTASGASISGAIVVIYPIALGMTAGLRMASADRVMTGYPGQYYLRART